ncbi:MAG TPA: hypothetical protein PKD05_04410 [Candidatus Melainabacteria bacterium]|nr:hypothetical protein [Candidatus Melainabacteria bacterium]
MLKAKASKYALSIIALSLIVPAVQVATPGIASAAEPAKKAAAKGDAGALAKNPDTFVRNYYDAIHKAKKLDELLPYYRKEQLEEMDKMNKEVPPDMDMDKFMLEMMRAEQPKEFKVVSKNATADRVEYQVEPAKLSPEKQALKAKDNYSMTGDIIVVKEDGNWKVYKDYWKSFTKDENGSCKSGFGIDPDKKKREALETAEDKTPETYDSRLRTAFFKDWKGFDKDGDVYVAMKLKDDGSIEDSHFFSKEKDQDDAIASVKEMVTSKKDLPELPAEYKSKSYVWMNFSWSDKGARAISGPYFDTEYPGWIKEFLKD